MKTLQQLTAMLLMSLISGCDVPSPASDYESYQPPDGHWALELSATDDVSDQIIADEIKAIDGINDGSVVVNVEDGYASFQPEDAGLVQGAAPIAKVREALKKHGVEVGKTKIISH